MEPAPDRERVDLPIPRHRRIAGRHLRHEVVTDDGNRRNRVPEEERTGRVHDGPRGREDRLTDGRVRSRYQRRIDVVEARGPDRQRTPLLRRAALGAHRRARVRRKERGCNDQPHPEQQQQASGCA